MDLQHEDLLSGSEEGSRGLNQPIRGRLPTCSSSSSTQAKAAGSERGDLLHDTHFPFLQGRATVMMGGERQWPHSDS